MSRATIWALIAGLLFCVAGVALVAVVGTANLGYDRLPGGTRIIWRWWYIAVLSAAGSVGCAVLAWKSRRQTAVK